MRSCSTFARESPPHNRGDDFGTNIAEHSLEEREGQAETCAEFAWMRDCGAYAAAQHSIRARSDPEDAG
jgi:hypothetical protein